MTATGFSLFETELGHCGIAWGERGIVAVQLPEAREALTRARMRRFFPGVAETGTPPPQVRGVAARIAALLRGTHDDLRDIELDMSGVSPFEARVYELVRGIAPGETLTYGEVAARIGEPGAACWPRAGARAASRPTVVWPPSCACCRSRARVSVRRPGCSTGRGWVARPPH
jgi:methylated-DNA-[protein]-cysteine S-methyltransferase